MTHERCSELLAPYVRGDLARDLAEEVGAHLAKCPECRAEERAVALMSGGGTGMDDVERARLHRGLAQELFTPRANADLASAPGGAPRWTRWLAPAAAAAVIAAGVFVVTSGGGDDADIPAAGQAPVEDADSAAEDRGGDDAGSGGTATGGKPHRSRALGAAAQPESAFDAAEPEPQFDPDLGSSTTRDLTEIGRSGNLFRSFADAYTPADGPALYERFLDGLAAEAIGADAEVEECAATLPQDGSLIPAYGALAEYEGANVLVLGFVTNDPGADSLDRYLIWVWERGSCAQPIDTLFGEIVARQ